MALLYAVYSLLLLFTIYKLFVAGPNVFQVVVAVVIGLTAGLISSRMYKISWSKDEAKVVGRIDIYGLVVLVLFSLFEFNKDHIAHLFANGAIVGTISLVLLTSALFGRVLGTAKKILRVLREERII